MVRVVARDPDGDKIHYVINATSSSDALYFTINPDTGAVSTTPAALVRLAAVKRANCQRDACPVTQPVVFAFEVVALDVGASYASHTARAQVKVTLLHVPQAAPRFRHYPVALEIEGHRNDYRQGSVIGKIDIDDNVQDAVLRFTDESTHKCSDYFHVDAQTGTVSVRRPLAKNMYECYLELSAPGYAPTTTLLQIFFLKSISSEMKARRVNAFSLKVEIAESTPPTREIVNLVSRSRMPALKQGHHRFQLVYSSINASFFDLHATTGILMLRKSLDYEAIELPDKIELMAVARKANPFDNPVFFNVELALLNVNDNAPRFTQQHYVAFVREGEHRGTFVTQISALDIDDLGLMHAPLTYVDSSGHVEVRPYHVNRVKLAIIDGNVDNAFVIEPAGSGVVKTNTVLDREIRGRYTLTIAATDEVTPADRPSAPRLTSTCTLEIHIIDVNDNVPVFPPYQEISVSEDAEIGTVVSTLTANDVDTFPALTYYKQRDETTNLDETDDLFDIGLYTGRITLKSSLSLRERRQYQLNILASDSQHTVETQVIVKVRSDPYNKPPPLASSHQYVVLDPLENDCIGTGGVNCEIARVAAAINKAQLERPALKVIYKLAADASRSFYVDQWTGIVYNNQSLKLASSKLFALDITAGYGREAGRYINALRTHASLLINVRPTESRDDFDEQGLNVYNIEVPAGGGKPGDVLLTLPLTHKYAYSLVDGNLGHDFLLLRNNQLVKVKRSAPGITEYKLEIEGKRKHVRGDPVRVLVNVKVLPEGPDVYVPRIINVKIPDSAAIGRVVTSVRSESDYGASFRYFIANGNELNHFRVDMLTGVLSVIHPLDFEKCNYYQLVVAARKPDNHEVTVAIVNVQLTNTHDSNVRAKFPFSQPSLKATIDENAPIGTRVVKVTDSWSPSTKFSLSEMSGAATPFALDAKSGYLVTTDTIDYERTDPPVYQLILNAYDEDTTRSNSETLIEIEVGSVDEFTPKFSAESYQFNVTATLGLTFVKIGRVMASDRDSGPDGKVIYHLRSSSPSSALGKFRINRSTGLLSISTLNIDDLPPKHSSLIVAASSGREGSLTSLTVVQVNLRVMDGNVENRIFDGPIRSDDLSAPAVAPTNAAAAGIPSWMVLLIVLLTLVTVVLFFSIVVMRLYHQQQVAMMGRSDCSFGMNTMLRKRQHDSTLSVGPNGQPTYVVHQLDGDHVLYPPPHGHHGGHVTSTAPPPPPCYNEVTLTATGLGEGHSASSGRGSAEDEDDVDQEIRMIIEGNSYYGDGLDGDVLGGRDSTVPTVAEYLARLGVVNHSDAEILENLNEMHENDDIVSEDLNNVKIVRPQQFSSVRSCRDRSQTTKSRRHRSHSHQEEWTSTLPGSAAMATTLSTHEELCEAYNWNFLQSWGPQYQPLSAVFQEIAKLKGTEVEPAPEPNYYDTVAQSRMETMSTISAATSRSTRSSHRSMVNSQTGLLSSPLMTSNPLIQASSTSAFSPVRPSHE